MAYEDLLKDSSSPLDNKNYFNLTITDLNISTLYPLEFRWKYEDGTFGPWSVVKSITTPGESFPNVPSTLTVANGTAGYLEITWDGNTSTGVPLTNFDRVDVYINGAPFDSAKAALSFFSAGTKTIPAPAGTYIISSYAVSKIGTLSAMSSTVTRTITSAAQPVATPEDPFAPTITAGLASIIVSWNGKKSDGNDFSTGAFASAKVYIGTSSGFTPSADNWVHSLNFANGTNQVSIGVGTVINKTSGAQLQYGTAYYIKIRTVNSAGTETSTAIASSPTNVTVEKLPASEISTGILTADNSITAGVSGGQRVVISGSAAPLIIYGTDGSTKLLEYLTSGSTGTLAIKGSGTFSGDLSIGSSDAIFKAEPATGIWLGNASYASAPFSVSVNGVIKANSGTIGGWTLGSTFLQGTNFEINSSSSTIFVGSAAGQHIRISASGGIATYNGGTQTSGFNLSTSGTLSLSGSVTASSGSIGGWTIGSTTLTGGNTVLNSNGTITVTGGSATTTINSNGTITMAAGSSGIGALTITGSSKTAELYSDQLKLNAATIFESTGTAGTPAGSLTFNTSNASKQIHFFDQNDIAGIVSMNKQLNYPGVDTATGSTLVVVTTGRRIGYVSSSRIHKKNISPLLSGGYVDKILQLEPVSFDWKTQPSDVPYRINYGLIAEDVSQIPVMESLVNYNENDEPVSISYDRLTPFLVMAIKELSARLDALEG